MNIMKQSILYILYTDHRNLGREACQGRNCLKCEMDSLLDKTNRWRHATISSEMIGCDYNGNYTQKSQRNNGLFWGSYKGSYILTATEAHCHAKQWLVGIWPCERQQPIRIENKQKTKHHQSMSRVAMSMFFLHTDRNYVHNAFISCGNSLSMIFKFSINQPLGTQFPDIPLSSLNKHQCQSVYQYLLKFC